MSGRYRISLYFTNGHCFVTASNLRALLRKPLALATVLALLPFGVYAQVTPPNSGQILQQVPQPPQTPPRTPDLTIQPQGASSPGSSMAFAVTHITLSGNTVFDTATLHALVASGEGRHLTLDQLNALAGRITAYYLTHGYPLARAIVPAQTLDGGTVRITILEARYDQVRVDNHSRIDNGLLQATVAPLQNGQLITRADLDRSLLLLGDLPGVSAHATLSPGALVGTSDLAVQVEPGQTVAGSVSLDNAGSRYTGRLRGGAALSVANPLHHGDLFSTNILYSGRGLHYGRLAYQYALNGRGTVVGVAYSALRYQLGDTLAALDAHGTASVGSVWVMQSLVRSIDTNVSARLQFDDKRLHDHIDSTALRDDRHSRDWTASIDAQHRDTFLGGGINSGSLSATRGDLDFDNVAAAAADAATVRTAGSFTRWNLTLARLQDVTRRTHLYLSVQAQDSSGNLDSSEQLQLGGPDSVRGYEVGTLSGATGYLATVELRHDLAWSVPGQWQGRAFVDNGDLTINPKPWTDGKNNAHLTSAGLGLYWIGPRGWFAQLQAAKAVAGTAVLAGKRPSARVWLQVTRSF